MNVIVVKCKRYLSEPATSMVLRLVCRCCKLNSEVKDQVGSVKGLIALEVY